MAFCFGTCATFNCVAAFGIRLNLRLEYIGLHGDSAAASDRYNTDSVLHNMHSRTSHRNALHNTDSVSHNMHSCTSHRTMHFITQTLCRTDAPHIAPALHNTDSVSHNMHSRTSHRTMHFTHRQAARTNITRSRAFGFKTKLSIFKIAIPDMESWSATWCAHYCLNLCAPLPRS